MVSIGVSKLGRMVRNRPDFYRCWVKINDAYYCEVLLTQKLLPVMHEICGEFFIFQQGNVPAHQACGSTCWNKTPAFILPDLLPPNSTNLNPIDCKIYEKCSSGSSKFMTSRNWSSGWSMCGIVSSKAPSRTQLMSGANVSAREFVWKEEKCGGKMTANYQNASHHSCWI